MNIHSFITENYIAPLQGYYSEARLTLARLKRRVLRLEYNVSERILGSNRCDKGSPFHTEGPTTENARAWVVEVQAKGTKSNPCSDEWSELRPLVPGVGQQRQSSKHMERSCLAHAITCASHINPSVHMFFQPAIK